jgi:hypothetical protein
MHHLSNRGYLRYLFATGYLFVVAVLWVAYAGKDLNFDSLNYHYYIAHSFWSGKVLSLYFPASIQSYLNPISFTFYYLLLESGLRDYWIAVTLAFIHLLNVPLLWIIARKLTHNIWLVVLLCLLAIATNIYWSLVGASFVEPILSIFILLCILLLSEPNNLWKQSGAFFIAGVLLGFKITGVIYVLPLFIFIRPEIKTYTIIFSVVVAGFMVSGGWWYYYIYLETGNPLFPFYNNIFGSEYFVNQGIDFVRFRNGGFSEIFLFPWNILLPEYWNYYELPAPDCRPLIFFVLLPAYVVVRVRRNLTSSKSYGFADNVIIYTLIVYCLWFATSVNGRYGLALFMIVGLACGIIIVELLPLRIAKIVIACIVIVQFTMIAIVGEYRWSAAPWSDDWYNINKNQFSEKLIEQPAIYLSVGLQSHSFLSRYLHEESYFSNISGQYSLSLDQLTPILNMTLPKRMIFAYQYWRKDETQDFVPLSEEAKIDQNGYVARLGYEVNYDECSYIESISSNPLNKNFIVICDLTKSTVNRVAEDATKYFDMYESVCEERLSPKGVAVDLAGDVPFRYYVGSEVLVYLMKDVFVVSRSRQMFEHYSLSLDDVTRLYDKGKTKKCLYDKEGGI